MKLVVLMYLEEDSPGVERLLEDNEVVAYSEVPVEGHGLGTAGWYGKVPAFQSRMLIAFLPADKAETLLASVAQCTGCRDANRPIHAWQLDVEKVAKSGASVTEQAHT